MTVAADEVAAIVVAANTVPKSHRKGSRYLRLLSIDQLRQFATRAKVAVEVGAEGNVKMLAAKEIKRFILVLTMTPVRIRLPQLYRIVERVKGVICLAFLKNLLPRSLGRNQQEVGTTMVLHLLHSNALRLT
jgi:hypothetical protein